MGDQSFRGPSTTPAPATATSGQAVPDLTGGVGNAGMNEIIFRTRSVGTDGTVAFGQERVRENRARGSRQRDASGFQVDHNGVRASWSSSTDALDEDALDDANRTKIVERSASFEAYAERADADHGTGAKVGASAKAKVGSWGGEAGANLEATDRRVGGGGKIAGSAKGHGVKVGASVSSGGHLGGRVERDGNRLFLVVELASSVGGGASAEVDVHGVGVKLAGDASIEGSTVWRRPLEGAFADRALKLVADGDEAGLIGLFGPAAPWIVASQAPTTAAAAVAGDADAAGRLRRGESIRLEGAGSLSGSAGAAYGLGVTGKAGAATRRAAEVERLPDGRVRVSVGLTGDRSIGGEGRIGADVAVVGDAGWRWASGEHIELVLDPRSPRYAEIYEAVLGAASAEELHELARRDDVRQVTADAHHVDQTSRRYEARAEVDGAAVGFAHTRDAGTVTHADGSGQEWVTIGSEQFAGPEEDRRTVVDRRGIRADRGAGGALRDVALTGEQSKLEVRPPHARPAGPRRCRAARRRRPGDAGPAVGLGADPDGADRTAPGRRGPRGPVRARAQHGLLVAGRDRLGVRA
jgi:hypothetical protein